MPTYMNDNYTQQKELTSFCNTIELIKLHCDVIEHIFRQFRHTIKYFLQWSSNKTAAKRTPKGMAITCITIETTTLVI